MAYLVTAAYVTVETDVGPGRARVDIPHGALLPADVPAEDRERALRLGQVQEVDDFVEPPAPEQDPEQVPDGTIAVVLDWVGGDPDRARRALEVELGNRARSTLIADLTAISEA